MGGSGGQLETGRGNTAGSDTVRTRCQPWHAREARARGTVRIIRATRAARATRATRACA
jgi:hypothetical protein